MRYYEATGPQVALRIVLATADALERGAMFDRLGGVLPSVESHWSAATVNRKLPAAARSTSTPPGFGPAPNPGKQIGLPMAMPRRWTAVRRAEQHGVSIVREAVVEVVTAKQVR